MQSFFSDFLGYDEDTAKAKCAEGCDANDHCKFANLYRHIIEDGIYYEKGKVKCNFMNEKCGKMSKWGKKRGDNRQYIRPYIYIKDHTLIDTKVSW